MKRCSASLVIREMQVKPPIGMINMIIPSVGEDLEQLELLLLVGMLNSRTTSEESLEVS